MYTIAGIFGVIGVLAFLVLIGFLVVLIVGSIKKNWSLKEIAIIGMAAAAIGGAVSLGIGFGISHLAEFSNQEKPLFKNDNSIQAKGFKTFKQCTEATQKLIDEIEDNNEISEENADYLNKMFNGMVDVAEKCADDQHSSISNLAKDIGGTAGAQLNTDNDDDTTKDADLLDDMREKRDSATKIIDNMQDDDITDDDLQLLKDYNYELAEDFCKILNIDDKKAALHQLTKNIDY